MIPAGVIDAMASVAVLGAYAVFRVVDVALYRTFEIDQKPGRACKLVVLKGQPLELASII